jgi:NAD(P)H-hydrate epimerase
MLVLTAEQMRQADDAAIEGLGIPSAVLMECAGVEVVRAMSDALGDLAGLRVLVLCGRGNNGGDGMVIARRLHGLDAFVQVLLLGEIEQLSGDARLQWDVLQRMGVPAEACDETAWAQQLPRLAGDHWDVAVDALLGTGTRGPLEGFFARVAGDVNASDVPVVAVDIPTGLASDRGRVDGEAVEASLTVALGALKPCHVFAPAMSHCGDVMVVDIGIPDSCLGGGLELIEDELVADLVEDLADRPEDTHKGSFGHVVVVGGQATSPGAPALAGRAALCGGAGLVTVAAPAPCTAAIASQAAELMHLPLPADDSGAVGDAATSADEILERATCLVIGPGLGRGPGASALLRDLLEKAEVPVVLDADALNLLADAGALPQPRAGRPLVLTPHPGEFGRLTRALGLEGAAEAETMDERLALAECVAQDGDCTVVVKGFRSVIATAGIGALVNPTGGPGLSTAGSGDVLAGFLGALIAQGLDSAEAACAAVHLHGRAGDLAELELGQMSLTASSLLTAWPAAVASVLEGDEPDDQR